MSRASPLESKREFISSFCRANLAEFLQKKISNPFARVSRWLPSLAMLPPRTDQCAVSLDRLPVPLVFARWYFPIDKPIAEFFAQRMLFRGIRDAVCFKS